MTTPPKLPNSDSKAIELAGDEATFREPADEEWAEIDSWEERNKDALAESFRRADEEYARGEFFTEEEVWARVSATIKKYARKV